MSINAYTQLIAEEISEVINEEQENDIENDIETNIETENDIETEIDPDKVKYYIKRGVEDVATIMEDLNFDVGGNLKIDDTKLGGIALNENGSAHITIVGIVNIEDLEKISSILEATKKFSLKDAFSKYVSWSLTSKSNISPVMKFSCKISIPSEVVSTLVSGNPNENWKKAITQIEKFSKTLMKSL